MSDDAPVKVSVLVLAYNQEDTVGRAIESVVAQDCDFPYEVIVVDDCSTDGTAAVCREYARRYPDRVRAVVNSANKELVANYYDTLLDARGRYIADCAGDDFWTDSRKLADMAAILDSQPDTVLVHSDWQYRDPDGTMRPSDPQGELARFRRPVTPGTGLFLPLLRREHPFIIHLSTALYRRSTFLDAYRADTHAFRNPAFRCEDLQLLLELSRRGNIAFLPRPTLAYSVGAPSVSTPADHRHAREFALSVVTLVHYFEEKYHVPRADLRDFYHRRLNYAYAMAYAERNPEALAAVQEWMARTSTQRTLPNALRGFMLTLSGACTPRREKTKK